MWWKKNLIVSPTAIYNAIRESSISAFWAGASMPGWEFMVTVRSEVGEKQDTPTGRVTLGSETRVRTQNAKALLSSWHRHSGDLALSSIPTSGTSCCYSHGDGWEESEACPIHWALMMEPESRTGSAWPLVIKDIGVRLLWFTRSWPGYLFVILDLCGLNQVCASGVAA